VNPYLGSDGVSPFIKVAAREQKGLFILVRTSNASATEFQDLVAQGKPIYRHVADRVRAWAEPQKGQSGYSSVGAVVGATAPGQLAELRECMPGILFLIPGYGAQGGSSVDVAPGFDQNGMGALINNSRGIAFAYQKSQYRTRFEGRWQGAVEQAVRDMIDDLAANTPAGRLKAS
jgi:orotidine-5'-phosphate decarboxylase